MILVTGAAGKTGQAIIKVLAQHGQAVRALAYRPEHVAVLQAQGAQEVTVGDLQNSETLRATARGTRAIYHICPNMHPREIEVGETVIAAAKSAGCEHFVYHSVLHPQTEAMPHHWNKLRVEAKLFESGLRCTILQPAAYMQNVLAGLERIRADGVYAIPYAAETRISMVDLRDIATAAARVLTEPGHEGATYELSGLEALSQNEVATILAEQLERPVKVEVIPLDSWTRTARANGLSAYSIETLTRMFRYYEQYGFRGNSRVLAGLLGRPPVDFRQFVERAVGDHKPL